MLASESDCEHCRDLEPLIWGSCDCEGDCGVDEDMAVRPVGTRFERLQLAGWQGGL